MAWPRGKVLGGLFDLSSVTQSCLQQTGSSAINGLYLNRPGKIEIDAWRDMLDDMDGADNWSWDSFYAAMRKSETFTPPTSDIAQKAGITWDVGNHGSKGPIHVTYPS